MANKLVLIDGNSILYRAFFALPLLNNDKGVYTNAVYGFTTMLLRILEEEKPSHMLVAFDAGKTTFRHETYKEYKGGRQKTPPELSEQFPVVKELLDAFQIKHYELDNYEADDIIGTLSKAGDSEDWEVTVISGDKDLLQLISDHVTVHVTKKGISEIDKYTPAFLKEKMGIAPEQVIDFKALMGDSSDNIPGVPGVGEKTALKLLKEYPTLEEVYENLESIGGKKLKENLTNHKEEAFMSRELVTINRDSPIEIAVEDTQFAGYESSKVTSVFKDLGFASLLNKISGSGEETEESADMAALEFEVVSEVTTSMFAPHSALVAEIIEENYHQAPIIGIGLANEKGNYFIPTDIALESEAFKTWAEDESQKKAIFDAKATVVTMLRNGIKLRGISFDMLLASYLLNPSENNHDIPAIGSRFGFNDVKFDEEVYGKGAKMKVPEKEITGEHIARKARALYYVEEEMTNQLKENEQYELLAALEMPLALILGEMEHQGVRVETGRLKEMEADLKARLDTLIQEIYALAGEEFNLNSPKQLGPILFEKLGLPVIKKTKTGYSTAADVLEQLESEHEIIPKILLYRQLGKLQSTYIEGLLKVVDPDTSKIHTRFNQALTQTGRLSSVEPNLQNIPIRLEEGRKIRRAFVPSEEDWIIFAADYSQIELRVLAHFANDEKLVDAFNRDMDIHTRTAMDVFHVDSEEVTPNMRRQAKAVNFGIVYGISDYGLSQSLGITRKQAKKFIDDYLNSFPGVKQYMEDVVKDCKAQGYVETLLHRRRYIPDITSRNFNLRGFAERTAMNTPIQGSAADIIKLAMVNFANEVKHTEFHAKLLLQVHDELIFEIPKEEVEAFGEFIEDIMDNALKLDVPLKVESSYGQTWYDAK